MNLKRNVLLLKLRRRFDYKNFPIMLQVFLIFVFVFIIMILLSLTTYINYRNDKAQAITDAIDSMNSQILDKIDGQIDNMRSITKLPYSYTVNNSNAFLNSIEMSNEGSSQNLEYQNILNKLFQDALNYNYNIHSVFVFNMKGVLNESGLGMYPGYNPKDEEWFKQTLKLNGSPLILGTFAVPYVADVKGNSVYVFSVARAIVDVNSSKEVGVILVNSKITFLSELLKKLLFVPEQRIAIIDKDNNTIYDTAPNNLSKKFDKEFSDLIANTKLKDDVIKIKGKKYLVSCRSSDLTNWKIVNIIPENDLYKSITTLSTTTIIITIFLVLIAMLFVVLFSRQIIGPIKKLVLLMKLIEKGDFNVKIKFRNRNELGQLAKTFNSMARKVDKLVNEVYLDKIAQKELELQMLQNQINPHFLYNTLESIHMMAEINDDEETSIMARALGRILRYGISRKHETVTIKQELDNLKDYILLQKIRFSDIFEIKIDVEEALYNYVIVKLILQPIVENAINHGLEDKLSGGLIKVIGYQIDNILIFEIIDNGKGMTEEMVIKMNNYISDLDNSLKSIGLKNVNRRIKLHYGNDYGIEIVSVEGTGTSVKITLPVIL